MNHSDVFITTSIPYVNAPAHVGHAQEFILTDAIARSLRQKGHKVTFQTGTDENAFKNVLSAQNLGVSPLDFVTANSTKFKNLADRLGISYDTFLRTTEERHKKGVHLFWSSLNARDLFLKSYSGQYCQGCEDFLQEKDLINGICPDHRSAPTQIQEQNIFFKLSSYQTRIEELISSDQLKITPSYRKSEILNFVRSGLQDISITRDAVRSGGWGIPCPRDSQQIIYVWIDALINYLSGQGFGESEAWRNVWNEKTHKIHVIGKNVWKFHAVYWPALLLSAGLPLPNEIVIHGFLTANGQKISKSLGNSIDPNSVIAKFGSDALRNYLLCNLSPFTDSDFQEEGLKNSYNVYFANTLGNLVSRLAALCRKANFSPPIDKSKINEISNSDFAISDIQSQLQNLWDQLSQINSEITNTKPWELIKVGDEKVLHLLLDKWISQLYSTALSLQPWLPNASKRAITLLDANIICHHSILYPKIE